MFKNKGVHIMMQNKQIFTLSTARTRALKETILTYKREISTLRGKIYTHVFQDNKFMPLVEKRSLAYQTLMENTPIHIYENELIVGNITEKRRGAFLSPETNIEGMSLGGKLNQPIKNMMSKVTDASSKTASKLSKYIGMQLASASMLFDMKFDNPENRSSHLFVIDKQEKLDIKNIILPYWKRKSAYPLYRSFLTKREKTLMNQFNYTAEHAFGGGIFLFHPNIEKTVLKGLNSIIKEADEQLIHTRNDYFKALGNSCRAVITLANRYADQAESLAEKIQFPERKRELLDIATICRHVPANPPRTFQEALQSLWFIYIAIVTDDCGHEVPFGRWDQVLDPFYKDDLKNGRITRSHALELIECYLLKVNEVEFLLHNSASLFEDGNSGRLTLTIGGVNSDGFDATNDVSYLFLEALSNSRMIQPNPAVRIHKNTPEDFMDLVTQIMASGANTVQLFNDETVIQGFVDNGILLSDARDYIIAGCVQQIPASTYGSVCAAHLVLPRSLELFLNKNKTYKTFDELYVAYKIYLADIIKNITYTLYKVDKAHDQLLPNTFISALLEGPLNHGVDIKSGGAIRNLSGISLLGLGTLTDSLMAIKQAVFEDKAFTLSTLRKILKQNFEGFEADRLYLLNKISKYGNDDDRVDFFALDMTRFCSSEVSKYTTYRKGQYTIGVHSENGHVVFGYVTGATPDGRKGREPLSIGAGSSRGREKKGYLAALRSVSKLDFSKVISGISVNLRFNPSLFDSSEKVQKFKHLIQSYFFDYNGQNLQTTIVDTATLLQAQEFPSEYQDLLVRISGYSARFVELARITQDEIISRTEYTS